VNQRTESTSTADAATRNLTRIVVNCKDFPIEFEAFWKRSIDCRVLIVFVSIFPDFAGKRHSRKSNHSCDLNSRFRGLPHLHFICSRMKILFEGSQLDRPRLWRLAVLEVQVSRALLIGNINCGFTGQPQPQPPRTRTIAHI
jgi:hypothetical protein